MRAIEPDYDGPKDARSAFTHPATHPLVLDLLLLKRFGTEYLAWEPKTLWAEIPREWGTTVSAPCRNKIQAIRTAHVAPRTFEAWEVFEKVAVGMVGNTPRFDVMERCTPAQAGLTLAIMDKISGKTAVGDEVLRYCAACCLDYGLVWAPGPLKACNKYIASQLPNPDLHILVREAFLRGYKPTFDGKNPELDTQVSKTRELDDFLSTASGMLLRQLKLTID